jgi:hypothetical protein
MQAIYCSNLTSVCLYSIIVSRIDETLKAKTIPATTKLRYYLIDNELIVMIAIVTSKGFFGVISP